MAEREPAQWSASPGGGSTKRLRQEGGAELSQPGRLAGLPPTAAARGSRVWAGAFGAFQADAGGVAGTADGLGFAIFNTPGSSASEESSLSSGAPLMVLDFANTDFDQLSEEGDTEAATTILWEQHQHLSAATPPRSQLLPLQASSRPSPSLPAAAAAAARQQNPGTAAVGWSPPIAAKETESTQGSLVTTSGGVGPASRTGAAGGRGAAAGHTKEAAAAGVVAATVVSR